MSKRQVEVFTAGCPVCEPAVQIVNELACPDCEVTVYNLLESGSDRAESYGIRTLPTVVVNGSVVSCCENRGPDRDELAAAGIGSRITPNATS
ncbi:MAG: thioredoxin family protein [Actinomycetota bacterium]